MRKNQSTLLLTLAIIAASLCILLPSASGQPTTAIFKVHDQIWSYYQEGNQPANLGGVNWKATNYNDSAWWQGYGVFAYEPDTPDVYAAGGGINTALNRAVGANNIITYYFRTQFIFPTNTTNVILYCTNLVDDGAVVYLNGQELYRLRVTPPTPAYGDFASGGPPAEGTQELVTIVSSLLRRGTNTLAVELHDTSGSSDVAFGMGLSYGLGDRAVITRQPASNIVAAVGDDVTLTVGATGTDLRYAWFRNNVFIPGQTSSSLTLNNVTLSSAANYHVVVSNAFNSVRSSNSVLVVVPDTFGPCVLAVYVPPDEDDRVFIRFNEDPLRVPPTTGPYASTNFSALNPTNYVITPIGSSTRLVVSNVAALAGQGVIRLTLATNVNRSTNYQICLYNLLDTGLNHIALNSCMPIGMQSATNPVPMQSVWRFNSAELDDAMDRVNWKAYNFNDNPDLEPFHWSDDRAMFYQDQSGGGPNAPCTTRSKLIQLGPNTYYYRVKFNLATNVLETNATAEIEHVIDDGAVFYLNGVEIYRFNMPGPAGTPVYYNHRATAAVDNATCRSSVLTGYPVIPVGHLLTRSNILAVEVHQAGAFPADLDTVFDASITITHTRYPPRLTNDAAPNTVRLRQARPALNQMRLFWTNGLGYALERTTNLTTPWLEVQPPSTNLTLTTSNRMEFYRLKKRH